MFKSKKVLFSILMSFLLLLSVGCGGKGDSIVISSKEFTENILLSKITIKYLENLGYDVKDETGLAGQAIIRNALTGGEVDMYWEYTGTAYMDFMKKNIAEADPETVYEEVKKWDSEENGIEWLKHSELNNTYCFVTTEEVSEETGIKTMSDMAKAYNENKDIRFIANPEYFERADGMKKINEVYEFEVPEDKKVLLELGLFYDALVNGEGEFTVGFTTDGMIDAKNLVVLEDDKSAFPIYYGTPCVRKEVLESNPNLPKDMEKLIDKIDTETMIKLNEEVDIEKKSLDEVADKFLKDSGLI